MNVKRIFPLLFTLFVPISGTLFSQNSYRNRAVCDSWQKDERTVSYVSPVKILWTSGPAGTGVRTPEKLLEPFSGQIAVNTKNVCFLSTLKTDSASILLDFGKEYHGGVQIAAAIRDRKEAIRVRVRLGESVSEAMSEEGSTSTNEHAVRDFVAYVPWLGTVEVGESGFRFVRIDLLDKGVELPLIAVRTAFKCRDLPYLGSFHSSDERLNTIWETGAYTVHLNMQNYLWDGIKRDRLVWLGDLHPEVMTVNTVFGAQDVVNKSLDFAKTDTPLPGWMNGMPSYSLWWLIIQRDLYLYQGNLSYLKEQQEYAKELVRQIIRNMDGSKENLQGGTRFLDWPTSEKPKVIHAGLQALTLMSLEAGHDIGTWLGDKELAGLCEKNVQKLRQYSPNPQNNKQAASLLSLAELLDSKKAAEIITRKGADGFSTFYGYYMLESLAQSGRYEEALQIISDYWGGMLDLGATTFWEDLTYSDLKKAARIDEMVPPGKYDIHADGGAYCYVGLRHSLCHGWASGPTSWLSRYVLGIRPLEPGFKKVEIRPHLGHLKWAEGTFPTPYGVIKVRHERQADQTIRTEIDAPDGIIVVK